MFISVNIMIILVVVNEALFVQSDLSFNVCHLFKKSFKCNYNNQKRISKSLSTVSWSNQNLFFTFKSERIRTQD